MIDFSILINRTNTAIVAATLLLAPAIWAEDTPKKKPTLPLVGSTEKLSFETDEGTWMSLDVTPDGQQIIFELLGDIYEMPITGGAATRITEGMGYDSMPRVSPDGKWITFISDRGGDDNLWVAKRDGTKPRKLSGEKYSRLVAPAWSPDSQYVAMTVGGRKTSIKMFHVNGGKGLTLTSDDKANPASGVGLAFSPDGKHIYYTARSQGRGMPAGQIARFDRETGEVDSVSQGEGGGVKPLVSPDGKTLVYLSRKETKTGIRVRDLISGADRMIAWPIQRDAQEAGRLPSRDYYPNYAFTPDSRALVLHTGGKIERIDINDGNRTVIPFTATVDLDIGPDLTSPYRVEQGPLTARLVQNPVHSPDGSKIAASILTKIYVTENKAGDDGSATPKRLTKGDAWEFMPVWSPDGRWIAYVTWSMDGGGHIWKIRSNGRGRPRQLTEHAAFYTDLTFSPDGEQIVAMRGNEYQRHQTFSEFTGLGVPLDLISLPADGGDISVIASANGARTPHFSADPGRIYLYSGDALISLRFDGSDKREHLIVELPRGSRNFSDDAPKAEDVRISPDGTHALAFGIKQLWAMPIPQIGGATPKVSVRGASVPAVQLTTIGADNFGWADGGKTVTWAIGRTVYTRPFDSIEFLKEDDEDEKEKADKDDTAKEGAEPDAEENPKEKADQKEEKKPEFLEDNEHVTAIKIALEAPRDTPSGSIILSGANLITMAGADTAAMNTVLANQDILVTDNRIVAIGERGTLDAPAGVTTVDVTGKYIMPGFIDTHAHWEFRTGDVLEPQNWSLVANLAYGVTAGLDVQTAYEDYFAYQDMVETGQSLGQRAFMTGPGVFGSNDFQSYDAVLGYLKRYTDHYRTKNIKSYLAGNRKQRQWVVKAAKELGLMPTTEGGGDMRLDITHAIDGMHGNEHTLTIAPMYRDVIELYAKTQTAYTPTLVVQYNGISMTNYFFTRTEVHDDPKLNRFYPHNRLDEMTRRRGGWARDDEFSVDEIASAAATLQRAGGLVGVGGHGELQGLGYHWEMWALAMGGMTPAEILRAATIDGAKIIGIDEDLGSIAPGKLADMVILNANPLADIKNTNSISQVMKNGALYDGDTLTQTWPVRKEMAPFWWWDEARH